MIYRNFRLFQRFREPSKEFIIVLFAYTIRTRMRYETQYIIRHVYLRLKTVKSFILCIAQENNFKKSRCVYA